MDTRSEVRWRLMTVIPTMAVFRCEPLWCFRYPFCFPVASVVSPADSRQLVANDVSRPQTLVLHLSDIFLYEPYAHAAAAASRTVTASRRRCCTGVWTFHLQWQVNSCTRTSSLQLILISDFLSLMFMVLFLFLFQVYFCSEYVWARQYKLHRVGCISGLAFLSCWAVWS